MGIKRSTIYRIALLAGFMAMLGFTYSYHLPKIESLLLVEIERVSQEQLPVRLWAQRLEFHLLPLGVVLEEVRILPQKPLDKTLAPANLKQVGVRLALLPLLRGEVRLSQVYLRDAEFNVFLKNDTFAGKRSAGAIKNAGAMKFDFNQLYQLPVDEISLENVQIQGRLDPQNVVFRISNLNVTAENRYQSVFVEIQAPKVQIKPSGPIDPLDVQLELRALVEAQEMQISAFKLKADESFVVASGRFNGDFSVGRVDNGAFDARTKVRLSDINLWENIFFIETKVPKLKGTAEVNLNMEVRKGNLYKIDSELSTHDVEISKYVVGNVHTHLTSDLKNAFVDSLNVENNSGHVELSKINVNLSAKPEFTGNIKIHNLEVKQLLEDLGVHHVPILIPVKGEAACKGALGDAPELNCQGKLVATHVHVDSGRPNYSTITEVSDAKINGQVKVTGKQVEYKADVELGPKSKGSSDGVINYDTGFKINYLGDLDFADVKNLVNLKIEGATHVTGNTQGNSDWATIDLNSKGKDMWLDDYPLGDVATHALYKSGRLTFENVSGQFGVSRYSGVVGIDLDHDRIRVSGQIPFMDLKDVHAIFQRKVDFPLQVSGTGTGQVDAEGPFRLSEMSYDFRSSFYRGQIANESFDEAVFHVKSKDGLVKTEKVTLNKATGNVEVKGQITPKGEIDTVVVGRGMRLEQSENVLALGLDIQGLADFTVLVRGQLPRPRVELNGRLSKVVLGDQPAEDSVFKLNFLPDRMEGSGQFLGTTLVSEFTFPYDNEAPFLFKLKTRKWDFTTAFSLVSRSARQIDFNTSLGMDVNLQAAHGGFWASSGQVKIDEFLIRKGAKMMSAEKPMILKMKQGTVNSENCVITSGDSYLKFDVAGLTRSNLNASLNGKLDLSVLGLFTPFISDLRGNMAISMDLKGSADKPMLSGSAYVDKGYAKFTDFVHPFSNVRADLLFNDNQILINALRTDLAGGKVSGEGKITFNADNRPVDLKGTFSDVKLNIPEGYKTEGSGNIRIHGDHFPYLMDIDYDLTGGNVVAEFTQAKSKDAVKASTFLPKFLGEDTFHPFTLGLDINFKNPVAVNNSLLKASVTGHIKATGTPDRLSLNGTLSPLPGGKVLFRDTQFDIGSAYVEYSGNAPTEPKIYVTASTRVTETVVDDQGKSSENQYDVNMLVQGHGPNPQLTFSSVPPLGQREIVSLLAFGVTGNATGTGADVRATENQNSSTSAAIGGALLNQAGGKEIKEALGVDVKVSQSQVIDNASQPKVTLSRQWTPKFGASASSTIEANPNNEVKLEYKMNQSMSVIGSWDGREALHDQQKDTTKNVLGLDLQYKMQFK